MHAETCVGVRRGQARGRENGDPPTPPLLVEDLFARTSVDAPRPRTRGTSKQTPPCSNAHVFVELWFGALGAIGALISQTSHSFLCKSFQHQDQKDAARGAPAPQI